MPEIALSHWSPVYTSAPATPPPTFYWVFYAFVAASFLWDWFSSGWKIRFRSIIWIEPLFVVLYIILLIYIGNFSIGGDTVYSTVGYGIQVCDVPRFMDDYMYLFFKWNMIQLSAFVAIKLVMCLAVKELRNWSMLKVLVGSVLIYALALIPFVRAEAYAHGSGINCNYDSLMHAGKQDASLHIAASAGDLEEVKKLVKNGSDVNEENYSLYEYRDPLPINCAFYSGNMEVVKYLLDNGATIRKKDLPKLLNISVEQENADMIEFLVREEKASVYEPDIYHGSALCAALNKRSPDIAETLIGMEAEETLNDDDMPPIFSAAYSGNIAAIEQELHNPENINLNDRDKNTPLHYAVAGKNPKAVEFLVENGAPLNERNIERMTPLALAAMTCEKEIAEYLLDRGGKKLPISVKCDKLDLISITALIDCPEITRTLINHGADVNYDLGGNAPLYYAVKSNNIYIATLLIENGADVNATIKTHEKQSTYLHLAIENGFTEMTELLIRNKADKTTKNSNGQTPLEAAKKATPKNREIIKLLKTKRSK